MLQVGPLKPSLAQTLAESYGAYALPDEPAQRADFLSSHGSEIRRFHLIVFPEGTRGNGVDVAECQPGIYYVAQQARAPIVPVFIENMQLLSTKKGKFHPIGGLRKIEVHYGEPIPPERYLEMSREEFTEFVRGKIAEAKGLKVEG